MDFGETHKHRYKYFEITGDSLIKDNLVMKLDYIRRAN